MGKIVYYAAMSLDGYIADPDDNLDWLIGFEAVEPGPEAQTVGGGWPKDYEEFYEGVGALVSGSVTYEWILEHAGDWAHPGKPYWVLTSRELPVPEGQDVRFNGSFEEMIESAGDRKLWIVGGASVAAQFAEAGLLDEVIATVVPVVLGAGKPLFERPLPGPPMRLTASLPRPNGMVELHYDIRRAT